jgi:predicted KAP-like P-loop ATPase
VNKSIPKTNTRYASEGSIIGSVNNVILEAVTGFVEVHEEDLSIRNQMKKLPKETSLLYNLVTDARDGSPVKPVLAQLKFSTDDCTHFQKTWMQTGKK